MHSAQLRKALISSNRLAEAIFRGSVDPHDWFLRTQCRSQSICRLNPAGVMGVGGDSNGTARPQAFSGPHATRGPPRLRGRILARGASPLPISISLALRLIQLGPTPSPYPGPTPTPRTIIQCRIAKEPTEKIPADVALFLIGADSNIEAPEARLNGNR